MVGDNDLKGRGAAGEPRGDASPAPTTVCLLSKSFDALLKCSGRRIGVSESADNALSTSTSLQLLWGTFDRLTLDPEGAFRAKLPGEDAPSTAAGEFLRLEPSGGGSSLSGCLSGEPADAASSTSTNVAVRSGARACFFLHLGGVFSNPETESSFSFTTGGNDERAFSITSDVSGAELTDDERVTAGLRLQASVTLRTGALVSRRSPWDAFLHSTGWSFSR